MTFQVSNGPRVLYHTDSIEFIPNYSTLKSMRDAGMTFRLDGSSISFNKLIAWLESYDDSYTLQKATCRTAMDAAQISSEKAEADAQPQVELIEADKLTIDTKPSTTVFGTSKNKLVQCIETGETWDKQSKAAKALGIDPAAVSDSLKTGRKRSGYTFQWVEV